METHKYLKRRVMFWVYFEYTKSLVLSNFEYVLPFVFLIILGTMVSVSSIFNNMPKNNLSEISTFIVYAIARTEILIKILLVVFFASVSALGIKSIQRRFNFFGIFARA